MVAALFAALRISALFHAPAPPPPESAFALRQEVRVAAGCDRLAEFAAARIESHEPARAEGGRASAETSIFAIRRRLSQTIVRFADGSQRSFGFDGAGWTQGRHDSGPLDLAPSGAAERAPWADACRFLDDGTSWSMPHRTTLDGYDFDSVTIEPDPGLFLHLELLFEAHSHLLVARYYGDATTIYTDYRRVDGVAFAFGSHSGNGGLDLTPGPADAVVRVDGVELFRTFPESDIIRPSRSLTNTEVLK